MTGHSTADIGKALAQEDIGSWAEREVARVESLPRVAAACASFAARAEDLIARQVAISSIPAPPFGERPRAEALAGYFRAAGLVDVHLDGIGNVIGVRPGSEPQPFVAVTAHIDTVFPTGTPIHIRRDGARLYGPGVSDNGAGIAALLAMAEALQAAGIATRAPIVFIGNVGEEGEGDIRGMRFLFADPHWRDAIGCTLVLDGAGTDTVVTEALGSRRFHITIRGAGGHSWSDFGVPNPVVVLARAIEAFARTPVPATPKTTFNIGVIEGGTSVNSIPESAGMKVDIRSAAAEQVDRLERALRSAIESAVGSEPRHAFGGKPQSGLQADISLIGDRPAARLNSGSRLLAVVRAVDARLDNNARLQRASTDANIPLSQGREAIAIGAGGSGGGAHTLHEWYDPTGRELGLRRILLTMLALAGALE
jgi:tripeptide aminopeptidase